jgi:hypothetical protein
VTRIEILGELADTLCRQRKCRINGINGFGKPRRSEGPLERATKGWKFMLDEEILKNYQKQNGQSCIGHDLKPASKQQK